MHHELLQTNPPIISTSILVLRILKALRGKSAVKFPECGNIDLHSNLSCLAFVDLVIWYEAELVFKFWPRYIDGIINVCLWFGALEIAMKFRDLKKKMYVRYGPPPFKTFDYYFLFHSK